MQVRGPFRGVFHKMPPPWKSLVGGVSDFSVQVYWSISEEAIHDRSPQTDSAYFN